MVRLCAGRDAVVDDGAVGCRRTTQRGRSVSPSSAVHGVVQHVGPTRRLFRLLRVPAGAPALAENALRGDGEQ